MCPAPEVSVVMPAYNAERFLREAIDSILSQTLASLELVVVDDGSTDTTPEILAGIHDPRCRIVRQANSGLPRALNAGIAASTAPLVARMDADDVAEPDRLRLQVAYLREHPEVGAVGTRATVIDEDGRVTGAMDVPTDPADIRRRLIVRNLLVHPAVTMRRDALQRAGLYDAAFPAAEEYDLWFRMLRVAELANLPNRLLRYRVLPGSFTARKQHTMVRYGLIARWRAIQVGLYSPVQAVHLLLPALTLALPPAVSTAIRRRRISAR